MRTQPHIVRSRPRVLLVGLPTHKARLLERHLQPLASVEAVAFPGAEFDLAAERFHAQLVVVDLTYLDGDVVRPLMTHRFLADDATIVYLPGDGSATVDDLGARCSRVVEEVDVETLVRLVAVLSQGIARTP